MSGETFFTMLGRQLAGDIARLPDAARERVSEAGRVGRAVNVSDLRELARRRLPPAVFDYVDGAAWDEVTARRNESDLRELTLRPRVLAGATDVDLSTEVLGQRVAVPLLGAPTGLTGLVHHQGEIGIARAIHGAGGVYVLSSAASRSLSSASSAVEFMNVTLARSTTTSRVDGSLRLLRPISVRNGAASRSSSPTTASRVRSRWTVVSIQNAAMRSPPGRHPAQRCPALRRPKRERFSTAPGSGLAVNPALKMVRLSSITTETA